MGIRVRGYCAVRMHLAFCLLLLITPSIAYPCTDGVDCFCDVWPVGQNGVVFCEDFEDTALYMDEQSDRNRADCWWNVYGSPVGACTHYGPDGLPSGGDDWMPMGQTTLLGDGTGPTPCVDIVEEGQPTFSDKGCGVAGETDCTFDGSRSLGRRLRYLETGGKLGGESWAKQTQFSISMIVKWSNNYLAPGDPDCPGVGCGPAHKMNEWGVGDHPMIGVSVSATGGCGRNHPFEATIQTTNNPITSETVGCVNTRPDSFVSVSPDPTLYTWKTTHDVGEWICLQYYFSGWGTTNGILRYYVNDVLVVDGTAELDSFVQASDAQGIGQFVWNDFYNGQDGTGSGWMLPTTAYRYEDNVIVRSGPTMFSCADLGWPASGAPPPPPTFQGITISALDVDVPETAWTRLVRLWAGAWRGGAN